MAHNNKMQLIVRAVVISISGFLLCLIMGYLYIGFRIFTPNNPGFQFIAFGLTGSIIFTTLKFSGLKNSIFALVFLYFADIVLFKQAHINPLVGHLLHFLGIGISIYLYFLIFYCSLKELRFGKFLSLAALIATTYLIISLITGIFYQFPNFKLHVSGYTFLGFLIGTGLGIGFEVGEIINAGFHKNLG
ncbi:MAG: hypothetical protein ONB05_04810 [candidate division KSB1 bacterium]|nr:hypothetical protein [candidate division KSB1 bacterium]